MLPEGLTSRYKRYKADSNAVASWLVTTAEKCGFQLPVSTKPSSSAKSRRLKGNARKLGREQGGAASKCSSQLYVLRTNMFIPLAECIARSQEPTIKVPESFAYILQHAIMERKRFRRYYEKSNEAASASSVRDGHGHFITILESVRSILTPNLAPGVTFENERTRKESDIQLHAPTFENVFSYLHVEGMSDASSCSSTKPPRSDPEPSRRVEVATDPDGDLPEQFMAKALFWFDVHHSRVFIRSIWQAYKAGECDLAAAAITTNTAIDFIRILYEDFERSWNDVNFEMKTCLECAILKDTPDSTNNSGIDLDVPCLMPGWFAISSLKLYPEAGCNDYVPVVPNDFADFFQSVNVIESSTNDQAHKITQDAYLAFWLIPEYCMLLQCASRLRAEHGFIHGLYVQLQQERPLLWLAFAIHIFIDTQKILQQDIDKGLKDLCTETALIRHTVKQILGFEMKVSGGMVEESTDTPLRWLLELMDRYTVDDVFGTLRKEALEDNLDQGTDRHMEADFLLQRDPIWCGLLLYQFRMVAQDAAINRANSFMSIFAAAHLYNALKQTELLRSDWDSMEHIFATHRTREIFVGTSPPTDLAESSQNMSLALGMSPTALARGRRRRTRVRFSSAARQLRRVAPMTCLFHARYCSESGQSELTPDEVMKVMQTALATQEKMHKTRVDARCVPIEGILSGLVATLSMETEMIKFDYLRVHRTCWRLLCRLYEHLGDQISDWNDIHNIGHGLDPRALHLLVQCLLDDATHDLDKVFLLAESAKILNELIEEADAETETPES